MKSSETVQAFREAVGTSLGRPGVLTVDEAKRRLIPEEGAAERAAWAAELDRELTFGVSEHWGMGWQPQDVEWLLGVNGPKHLLKLYRGVAVLVLRRYEDDEIPPAYRDQVAGWDEYLTDGSAVMQRLTVGGPAVAVDDVVDLCVALCKIPQATLHLGARLGSRQAHVPSPTKAATSDVDPKVLAKIRALLAKAESTTYDAEAETFMAGAQSLATRHAVSLAAAKASQDESQTHDVGPSGRRIGIASPYQMEKASLLHHVAEANSCKCVFEPHTGMSTVIGYDHSIQATETLFTSLIVQASSAMHREGKKTDGKRSRTRSFRQAFLLSFAHRMGERLSETAQAERDALEATSAALPVLASQEVAVQERFSQCFPNVRSNSRGRSVDSEGWSKGRLAADTAHLAAGAPLER